MKTWYRTKDWDHNNGLPFLCDPVEVDGETEKFVIINGSRFGKDTAYEKYFKTKEEVQAYHINRFEELKKGLENRLAFANKRLEECKNAKI